MISDLIEEEKEGRSRNETLELMEFIRDFAVPLTKDQIVAMLLLSENGLQDISNFMLAVRPLTTPSRNYFTLINKLTLADRIKGNAKLSSILKANANPANAATLSAKDLEMKALSEKELRR